jgi:two-component system sensor histidine kinase ChvG
VILTSRSPRALFKGIYQDRIKIALGILGTLSVIALLAVLVSRGIARPIEKLSEAPREVTTGGGTLPPAPATSAVEIRTLYEDFSLMAEAVDRRSRYLRDFAAAVSHEFKTPLAGIQGAVELLQDHGETMETAQRRRFLDNIAADARRLSGLVTRLLDLARADMARPDANLSVEIGPAISKAVDARAGELRSRSISGIRRPWPSRLRRWRWWSRPCWKTAVRRGRRGSRSRPGPTQKV